MRSFFGINLPQTTKQELAAVARSWDTYQLVKPENLHLTLVFLGEVNEADLPLLENIASSVALEAIGFVVQLDVLLTKRDMLWSVARQVVLPLMQLQGKLEKHLMSEALMESPRHEFHPHVKLGHTDHVGRRSVKTVTFPVSSFSLFQTEFIPRGGVKYHAVTSFPLSG